MNAIYIIGVFLSFFISLLLFTKNEKSLPDKILATLMAVIGAQLLNFYIYTLGYWKVYPHLVGIASPFPFFYGALLYLYVAYSIRKEKHLQPIDYLHFLPILLSYLYMFKFFFFYTEEEKHLVDTGEIDVFNAFSNILLIGFAISFITYPILSFNLLNKYRKVIKANFSNDKHINFRWLRTIIISLGVLFLVTIIVLVLQFIFDFKFNFQADNIFYGLTIILIIVFGYYGIRQQNIFSTQINTIVADSEYEKSGLKPAIAEKYHKQLLDMMVTKKPYLDEKLTLSKLATIVGVLPNNLSQIINQYEKVNFHDFVNRYRVEEFKIQAKENPQYSILALALESGFNSKSAFNQIFKKQTGQTPSQYLKEL